MVFVEKLFDPERRELAELYHEKQKKYNRYSKFILLVFWIIFFYLAFEIKLYNIIGGWIANREISIFVYIAVFFLLYSAVNILIEYLLFYRLDREFELSNQNSVEWFSDNIKGLLLGLVILYAGGRLFIYTVERWPVSWWIPFSVVSVLFVILFTFLFPKVVLPIFFTLEEYPEGSLKERLFDLIERTGLKVKEIYEINLSSKMNYGNAGVMGFGKTRKIILGDNLTDNFNEEEIEAILAHELGHHANGDIIKNLVFQPFSIFIVSFIISHLREPLMSWMGYQNIIYSLPLILLVWKFFDWLISPLFLYLSRRFERAADQYALEKIENPRSFASALAGLADEGLAELDYGLYKLLFKASHPPIGERVENILNKN